MSGKYQTRSESNGIHYFDTLDEAIKESVWDSTVWKISFTGDDGRRHRFVRKGESNWEEESLENAIKKEKKAIH